MGSNTSGLISEIAYLIGKVWWGVGGFAPRPLMFFYIVWNIWIKWFYRFYNRSPAVTMGYYIRQ